MTKNKGHESANKIDSISSTPVGGLIRGFSGIIQSIATSSIHPGVGQPGSQTDAIYAGRRFHCGEISKKEHEALLDQSKFMDMAYHLCEKKKAYTPDETCIKGINGQLWSYDYSNSHIMARDKGDFEAVRYNSADGKSVQLSFAGTALPEGKLFSMRGAHDVGTDVSQLSSTPKAYKQASEWLRNQLENALKDGKTKEIKISGHSLGGGLTQYAMLDNADLIMKLKEKGISVEGFTVNPAALNKSAISDLLQKSPNAIDVAQLITHSVSSGDAINMGESLLPGQLALVGGRVIEYPKGGLHFLADFMEEQKRIIAALDVNVPFRNDLPSRLQARREDIPPQSEPQPPRMTS